MSRRPQLALVALPLAVCPPVAVAQAPSPPGVHERELAQIIRQAGYDCREVESIEVKVSPDPAFDSLRPEVATCKNGKSFWSRSQAGAAGTQNRSFERFPQTPDGSSPSVGISRRWQPWRCRGPSGRQ